MEVESSSILTSLVFACNSMYFITKITDMSEFKNETRR
jgi:hypothetical protein